MSLEATLADITTRLRENGFPNEQAVSQGIVLRVLAELGWSTYDTTAVWPEYQTGSGRADFALCHPPKKPAILIEVKQVGRAESAVHQALEYAFHSGVPFVVLTDGQSWSFYLPAEQGDYDERRVNMLDLYERSAAEAAETFRRYLARKNVASGQSLEAARNEYRNRNRRSQAKAAIPEAWRELVEKRDSRLVDSLTDAVESNVGFPPDADDVVAFLGGTAALRAARPSVAVPPPSPRTERRRDRDGHVKLTRAEIQKRQFLTALFAQARDEGIESPFRNLKPAYIGIHDLASSVRGIIYRVAVNRSESRILLTNKTGRWTEAPAVLFENRQRIDKAFAAAGLPQPLEWRDQFKPGRWKIGYVVDANYRGKPDTAKLRELNQATARLKRVLDPYLQQLDARLEDDRSEPSAG